MKALVADDANTSEVKQNTCRKEAPRFYKERQYRLEGQAWKQRLLFHQMARYMMMIRVVARVTRVDARFTRIRNTRDHL